MRLESSSYQFCVSFQFGIIVDLLEREIFSDLKLGRKHFSFVENSCFVFPALEFDENWFWIRFSVIVPLDFLVS